MELEVAKESDFGQSRLLAVKAKGLKLVLIKEDDGTFSALEDRCSHAEIPLSEGSYEDGQITCHAHGARFDTKTGKQLCLPAFSPVKSFKCRCVESVIFVDVVFAYAAVVQVR